jgi:hypothetical protein
MEPSKAIRDAQIQKSENSYEAPTVKTFDQSDVLNAVNQGSKFPARGFAG